MGRCEYVKTWKAAKISPNIPGGDLFMVHHINWFTDAPVIYGFCEALAKFKIINGVAMIGEDIIYIDARDPARKV